MEYFKNRDCLQTFFNCLAILGTGAYTIMMFSYINVESRLTETYSNNTNTIQLDQFRAKSIGSLLLAWCMIICGAQSLNDLNLGQYKRLMFWVLNMPATIYFIINPILAIVAVNQGIYNTFPTQTIILSSVYGGISLLLNLRYMFCSKYKNEVLCGKESNINDI